MEKTIYLDNAATTFPKIENMYIAMDSANRTLAVNAGRGSYRLAQKVTKLLDGSKNKILELIHAEPNADVVFSPSVTIALNQIIFGIMWGKNAVVYVSPYEHNAVARTLNYMAKESGIIIRELPIHSDSLEIDIDKMKYEFSKVPPFAIFSTHVSNVTGYILPIKEIFEEGKKYNSINVLDSAQSMGLIEIDVRQLKVDIIAFTGHKTLYGPFGIGGFVNINNIPLREFIVGGTGSDSLNLDMPQGSPQKYEAASSNIVAIAGLNAALDDLPVEKLFEHEKMLTEYLIEGLLKIKGIIIYIPQNRSRHIGIVSFNIEGFTSDEVGMILDEDFNIAVRTGYHCAPYIHKYLKDEKHAGTVRVGIGRFNNKADIDFLIEALFEIIE